MVHVIHVVADMMGSVADTMLGVVGMMHGVANMMCDAANIMHGVVDVMAEWMWLVGQDQCPLVPPHMEKIKLL